MESREMNNREYLEAYIAWKDMVNTEDVDTPERFDVYLESVKNAEIVEAARESLSFAMDRIETSRPYPGYEVLEAFVPVAEDLGLDTTFWKPTLKLTPREVVQLETELDDDGKE